MRAWVLAAVIAGGCGNPSSQSDAGSDGPVTDAAIDAFEGVGFRVAGSVIGVREPIRFLLSDGTATQAIWVTEDGPFRFPRKIADGTAFTVNPDLAQPCDPQPFTGTIQGADANVVLACDGVVDLAAVQFSVAIRLHPRFDPRAFSYTGEQPWLVDATDTMTVTPTPAYSVASVVTTSSPSAMDTPVTIDLTYGALARQYQFAPLTRVLLEEGAITGTAGATFGGTAALGERSGGNGVALSGDTLVVGAPGAGKVYVYARAAFTWTLQHTFDAPVASSAFGIAVAIDGNTVVIGAPQAGTGGTAYVSTRAGTTWSTLAPLAATPAAGAALGATATIAGGYLAIGAPGPSDATGSVYVFKQDGNGAWQPEQTLTRGTNGNFGGSLSMSGGKLAVGAPSISSVYIFDAATWTSATVTGTAGSHFGAAVALDGTLLAVGAPNTTVGSDLGAGAVQLFRFGATWTAEKTLVPTPAPPSSSSNKFGLAVGVDREHVIVGAPFEDCNIQGIRLPANQPCSSVTAPGKAGTVYLFRKAADWYLDRYVKGSTTALGDELGTSVAIDNDTFVGAAPKHGATDSGAVYVLR